MFGRGPSVAILSMCVQDSLAANVTQEQGKTLADAKGDVFRGLGKQATSQFPSLAYISVEKACSLL